jgi:hypothetical protein
LYDERVAVVHWVGAAAICAGLATLIAVAAPTRSHQVGADARWLAGGGLTGAVVVVLVLAAARVRSSPQGFLLATAAAVAWGLSDALNKAAFNAGERGSLELLRAGQTYAFVGVAVVALTLTQLAFRVAVLPVCLPSLAVGEPVVGLFLGIVVLSVRLRHSALAIAVEAVAGAVIVAGAVPLARAPVVAGQG